MIIVFSAFASDAAFAASRKRPVWAKSSAARIDSPRVRKSSCCFRDVVRLGIELGRATVLAGALPRRGGIEGLTSFRISTRCPAMPLQLFEQERGRLELTAL